MFDGSVKLRVVFVLDEDLVFDFFDFVIFFSFVNSN